MDIFECLASRRTIRRYEKRDVPNELIVQILTAGTFANSAGDTQPWEFVVVKDKKMRKELYEAALKQKAIEDAPVLIVVCANLERSEVRFKGRGKNLYSIQDSAACIQNMLLAAHALDLGVAWIRAFEEERVKVLLGIPDAIRPVAILTIGFPISYEEVYSPNIIPFENITWSEKYGKELSWFKKYGIKPRFKFRSMYGYAKDIEEKVKEGVEQRQKHEKKREKKGESKTISNQILEFIRNLAR